jgi:cytoskeletal protein RodZ
MLYSMDAYEILEILELSSEELLDRFEDKIIKDYEKIEEYLDNG